jgi:esterase/lipase
VILLLICILTAFALELSNPLNGTFSVDVRGSGKTAVIFVHDYDEDKRNFDYLAQKVSSRGLVTVNFDLSGHGARNDSERDMMFMHRDVRTIIQYLHQQNITDIQCVGEGIGGIICLQATSEQTPINQISIISPVGLFQHQSIYLHLDSYRSNSFRPLYIIVSNQDTHGIRATMRLEEQINILPTIVDGSSEGVSLIREYPHLERELINWIIRAPHVQQDWSTLPPVKVGPSNGNGKR